jgi:glycosyltransferase involved in cell wall biosynthesis
MVDLPSHAGDTRDENRVRLLVVSSIFPRSERDPQGSFVRDQARALVQRGHEVEVVVIERVGTPSREGPRDLASLRSVHYVPAPLYLGVGAWTMSVRSQLRSLKSSFTRGFDAAVVHDELVAAAVNPLLWELDIPWVLVVHGTNRSPAMNRRAGVRAKNDVYAQASAIVTVGAGVDVPLWAITKQRRIPNGAEVPDGVGEPPERTASVMAVSVSGLRRGKGIEDNLASLDRLAADGVDVGYWIAGDGPLRRELEALSRRLGLRERVRFLGSVPRDRLGTLLAASDFFALPSSPEAFGIAYVEAMQAGKPVIACRGEGPAGFTADGEDGFLVTPGNARELDRAWRVLSSDPALRTRMGDHARAAAEPFTWRVNAEAMEWLLAGVIEEHEPRPPGRDLWWLGVEPTAYMLDGAMAVRRGIPDSRLAFIDGGGDASPTQLFGAVLRRRASTLLVEGWGHPKMLLAMGLAVAARVPFIVASDTHAPAGGRSRLIRRIVRACAIRPLVRRAAVLLPGGTPQARYVRELVGRDTQPVVIAHMTVDTDAFERVATTISREERTLMRRGWGCTDDDVVVLFVGRIVVEKGLPELIGAIEELRDPHLKLVVYGTGPLEGRLRAAAKRSPIHLAGSAGKETLATAYASADVFVLPSRFEPWGLVVNEAMASGLACVVSDAVGCGEDLIVPGVTGWVVPRGDVDALAGLLGMLAADESLRRKTGAAARAGMRDWSMGVYAASVAHAVATAREHP